ncbi:MAG: hypothetical protein ACRC7C_03705, partial [Beijerinckiaceae bacterium]
MTGAVTDEMLMALADGELPMAEANELRSLIGVDPDLAERFALFAETAALLAPDSAADAAEVPDHLRAAVLRMANEAGATNGQPINPLARFAVVAGGAATPESAAQTSVQPVAARPPAARTWLMPLAASVALMIGGFLGYSLRGPTGGQGDLEIASSAGARTALAGALASLPSGETRTWSDAASGQRGTLAIIATHRMAGGGLCREAEITGSTDAGKQTIIACRKDGGWRTQAVIANGGANGFT